MSHPDDGEELTGEGVPRARQTALDLVVFQDGALVVHAVRESGPIAIGRAADADVIVTHESVSRRHAVLDLETRTFTDLGSRNGSTVRGEPVTPQVAIEVRPGDSITVGDISLILQRRESRPQAAVGPASLLDVPLEGRLVEETARSARSGEPFVHARIQVDVAHADAAREVLLDGLRASDALAEDRPGQFQLLLPGLDAERGRTAAQRLVGLLAGQTIASQIGLAAYPHDGITAAQLSARARELVGMSRRERTAMDDVRRLAASVAGSELTVLVTGETGAGKELVAEMVHRASPRGRKPFLRVNCAAIAEPLLESELFGHSRGAFTGAETARTGLIETASGGTLFLDEIGEMGLRLQASLLRVLEERAVRRIGESESRPVDVAIVCATNRSLVHEVEAGRFRRDLYYRISGVTIAVPPLRERPYEIEPIARAFAALAAARTQRTSARFTDEAIHAIRTSPWPGNIRELRNAVERAVLLAGTRPIGPNELGLGRVTAESSEEAQPPSRPTADRRALAREVADLERRRIQETLDRFAGNQTRAARELGVSRTTLSARLDAFGLRRPRKS